MNNSTRLDIALKTDSALLADIGRYGLQLSRTPKSLRQIRIALNKRLQANIDEHQKRLLANC